MASPGKLPRNPTFAIARFKYGIGPAEDAKSHTELEESVCAGLVEKSMRELVEGGQGITLSTVMEQMAFVHGFDALANSELIQRSINMLRDHSNMTVKGIVRKRGPWYKFGRHTEGPAEKAKQPEDVANANKSFELNCKKLILQSLGELQGKAEATDFHKLTQHMAFRHGFNVNANRKLIVNSLKEFRKDKTIKKKGSGYILVGAGEKVKDPKRTTKVRSTKDQKKITKIGSTKDARRMTYNPSKEPKKITEKTSTKDPRMMSMMTFGPSKDPKKNVDPRMITYSPSKKRSTDRLTKSPGSSCSALILTSMKELDKQGKGVTLTNVMHHMAFEHSFNVQDNTDLIKAELKALLHNNRLIKKGCKYTICKESKNGNPRARQSKPKMRDSLKSPDSQGKKWETVTKREMNDDIKKLYPWAMSSPRAPHVGYSDHALRSRSHIGLENNSQIIQRSMNLHNMSQTHETNETSKSVAKKTSLFNRLPPEMGLAIFSRLFLSDLDALFTAFPDLRLKYMPFLRSLTYSDDPECPYQRAFPCEDACETYISAGIISIKYIFLPSRHFRFILRNSGVQSLTVTDSSGQESCCTRRSVVMLTGLRNLRLGISGLRIVNAELTACSYSALPYVRVLCFEWTRPRCRYSGKPHISSTTFPVTDFHKIMEKMPNLEWIALINYELDWEYMYFNTDGWTMHNDLAPKLDLTKSRIRVPRVRTLGQSKALYDFERFVEEGRIHLGTVDNY